MSTALYRHFAQDGTLLYVGISLSWPARTKAHSYGSDWFNRVARVELERFATRADALEAERQAIVSERPKFNIVHNGENARNAKPARYRQSDPLLNAIKGPDAVVGPALVYRDDTISVMVAHGESGTEGNLTELLLGDYIPELPSWTDACDSVITLRGINDMTLSEAREARKGIIEKLSKNLRTVEAFDTDLALSVAYASRFPSAKSRQMLDEVAVEKGVAR